MIGFPALVPTIWGHKSPPPKCKLPRKNPVPYVLRCFQQDKCYLPRLLASLFLHFEKFYVKLSVCFCLISVKVSEFIYFEIYLRKQLKRTQKSTQYDCTKNTAILAVLQLQMEIVYNVNAEFLFNSTENIIYKMSLNICIRLCAWFAQMLLWRIRLDWF